LALSASPPVPQWSWMKPFGAERKCTAAGHDAVAYRGPCANLQAVFVVRLRVVVGIVVARGYWKASGALKAAPET
jgi:hypothetical protein